MPIPVEPPIFLTATFRNPLPDGGRSLSDRGFDLKYSREENPTVRELERLVARLDGFSDGLTFTSGMAAISALFISYAKKGIVVGLESYPTTVKLALDLKEMGFTVDLVPVQELPQRVIKGGLVFVETLTNPMLKVPDIPALSDACQERDCTLALDNTFLSPILFKPSRFSDYSVQSATKYLSGHNDVIAGVLTGNEISEIWEWRRKLGSILDPIRAYLVIRGMQTLELRMLRHSSTALEVARFLEGNDLVDWVSYPGLESHPQHELAKSLFKNCGGVITFRPKVDAELFLRRLRVIVPSPSLGATRSLISMPFSSASHLPERVISKLGLSRNLLRLSVGLEDPPTIIEDLRQAMEAAKS